MGLATARPRRNKMNCQVRLTSSCRMNNKCLRRTLMLCEVVCGVIFILGIFYYCRQESSPRVYIISRDSAKDSETELIDTKLQDERQDDSPTVNHVTDHVNNITKLQDARDSSATFSIHQSEKKASDSPPTRLAKLIQSSTKSLLHPFIQLNSTHINGKLLELVDVKWNKNIYFSVKTTGKYFSDRLSALIPTWFQVVNKKTVSSLLFGICYRPCVFHGPANVDEFWWQNTN